VALAALPALVVGPLGLIDPERPTGLVASLAIVAAADAAAVWLLVVRTGALRWRDMGWPTWRSPGGTAILTDIAIAAALTVPVTIAARLFAVIVALLLGVQPPMQVPLPRTDLDVALLFIGAVAIAPVAEETIFRGLALTAWWRDLGPRAAIVRSSFLFAIVHIANIDAETFAVGARQALFEFVAILPIGVFFGWLFTQRGMAGTIAAHATFNGIQVALLVYLVRSGVLPAA
jgi:membrane protease YdiL (CAAX protease family)